MRAVFLGTLLFIAVGLAVLHHHRPPAAVIA